LQRGSSSLERPVRGPEYTTGDQGGGEELQVNPAEAPAIKMGGVQSLPAPLEVAASQLTYHEWVAEYLLIVEKLLEADTPRLQVFDPD
jgi:hypothetical protein